MAENKSLTLVEALEHVIKAEKKYIQETRADIEKNIKEYVHPKNESEASQTLGLYKTKFDDLGHIVEVSPVTKEDIEDLGITPKSGADWNQTDESSFDYIKNKPTIPSSLAELTDDQSHRLVTDGDKEKWNAKSNFSGSYDDLTDKPPIPSIEGLATEDYVDDKIADMVNSAPETLDTLNELAAALGDDPNFATTVATEIGKKVNKEEGKGLSTNDYTNEEKERLASLTVEVGEGENSLIANDVAEDSESRNIATSKNSSAFGTSSKAGSKGFKLATLTKDVDANTATYGIAHKSTEDDIIDEQLAELQTILGGGTEILVSIMYNSNFDLCGKITKIEVRKESLMSYITIDNIPQQSDGSAQDLIPNADPLSATNTLRLYQYPQFGTIDVGNGAFASGGGQALAPYAHAEGYSKAIGKFSHAEGRSTLAVWGSHSEGQYTKALNLSSHAEGQHTQALGESSHAEGDHTVAESAVSHAEGSHTRTTGGAAHAEGYYTEAIGEFSHAEGDHTNAEGGTSHAEGYYTTSSGAYSHSEGEKSTASGKDSHAEGANTTASAYAAHAEGSNTSASGAASHTEGTGTQATVTAAHAEGTSTTASHDSAHAEGYNTTASGQYSHAEGHTTQATKTASHAEGHATIASNTRAHAEGGPNTVASGESSHAEGYSCKATARASHAGGYATTADSEAQTTIGKFNKIGTGALFVVGNGTSESNRTNVFEVYNDRTEVKTAPTNLGCVRNIWAGNVTPEEFMSEEVLVPEIQEKQTFYQPTAGANINSFIKNISDNANWHILKFTLPHSGHATAFIEFTMNGGQITHYHEKSGEPCPLNQLIAITDNEGLVLYSTELTIVPNANIQNDQYIRAFSFELPSRATYNNFYVSTFLSQEPKITYRYSDGFGQDGDIYIQYDEE